MKINFVILPFTVGKSWYVFQQEKQKMASVFILFYVILFNFDIAFVQFDLNSSARLIKYCLNSAPNINF